MNGRVDHEPTPEGRLAAVARSLAIRMAKEEKQPDYADYRDALRHFVERELILARIDEARRAAGVRLTDRVAELARELLKVNARIQEDIDI